MKLAISQTRKGEQMKLNEKNSSDMKVLILSKTKEDERSRDTTVTFVVFVRSLCCRGHITADSVTKFCFKNKKVINFKSCFMFIICDTHFCVERWGE